MKHVINSQRRVTRFISKLLIILFVPISAQTVSPEHYTQMQYRHIGPVGNRVVSVAGIEGDPLTYYTGAASGGIWKTVDGGLNWDPILLLVHWQWHHLTPTSSGPERGSRSFAPMSLSAMVSGSPLTLAKHGHIWGSPKLVGSVEW